MQLKVFLLIGFVLNAFCLNNISGGFLSPKYDLPKNESLVESLRKSSFAELFIKADPQKTDEVIDLLEALIAEASAALDLLHSHVTDAAYSLNTADDNVATALDKVLICNDGVQTARDNVYAAEVALSLAKSDQTNAESDQTNAVIDQTNAVNDQQWAQLQKDLADQNYAEQSPALIDEQEVLQQIIDSLGGLKDPLDGGKGICQYHDEDYASIPKPTGINNWALHSNLGYRACDSLSLHRCIALCLNLPDCTHFSHSDGCCFPFKDLTECQIDPSYTSYTHYIMQG